MANTFSWSFEALDLELGPDAEDHRDIVMVIHWRYTATAPPPGHMTPEGDEVPYTASSNGTSSVTWEEGDPWIPYADLEESDIQGWTEEQITEVGIAEMQARLDANIAEQITPTHETMRTMPWDEDDS
tara:strand:- start:153 stop:536 length:384 start_codon:yes stop_codon:yes gene_type:complete